MMFFERSITLSNENIQTLVEDSIAEYEKLAKMSRKDVLRLQLHLEELLLEFRDAYGAEAKCKVSGIKQFNAIRFQLVHKGQAINPLELGIDSDDEDEMEIANIYQSNLGLAPEYSYRARSNENIVRLNAPTKPMKNKLLLQILSAVLLAVVSWVLIRLLPDSTQTMVADEILQPLLSKVTSIISAIATPLVFFAVIDGIVGVGNTNAVGKMGRGLLISLAKGFLAAAIALLAIPVLFFGTNGASSGSGSGVVGQMLQLVLDIIPSNLLECFVNDNGLQVITLGIFVGFILLTLDNKVTQIMEAIRVLSAVVNKMMMVVCKLLPFLVYLGILSMLLRDVSQLHAVYKVVIEVMLCWAFVVVSVMLRTRITTGASIRKLFSAQFKSFMINITTSSQVTAMPESIICLRDKFGINEKFVNFSLPIAIVTYMPCGSVFLASAGWVCAVLSGAPIDMAFVIKMSVIGVIAGIAAPPIPGSALAIMPIIFSAGNISMDYFMIAAILATIMGYFLPVLNGYCLQLEILMSAHKLDLVDEKKFAAYKRQ